MTRELPSGTVTFLFSDVEGSTALLRDLGADRYARVLTEHRDAMRAAFAASGGVEVGTEGDSFFVAFPTAAGALQAAAAAQQALERSPLRVRMGIHTGTPEIVDDDYVGIDVHRAARIAAAGHGGQVLLSAATVALVGADGLRDLGEHRLKDLSRAERIWQLGSRDFPRLRSLYQTNLPIAPTPFIGRDRELSEVNALFRERVRAVTLTGPGGTGKTRLAMQAAAEATDDHPHGVWWVPLDALRQPELVLDTAAKVVGAKEELAAHIGDRAMLIAFDNFEQVIDAASDVAGLLGACPRLDVLVTSREPLRIRGEREYAVASLGRHDAATLFIERAREVRPNVVADDDVLEICRRLDDLPLAIELAAARVKVLSPAQIRARLEQRLPLLTSGARDLPERQRTLRGTIEWSYDLLGADEQRLFARLSVFRGGCTLEAAESVCDADLDTLQSLVEKSLVRRDGDRFMMLETIREYAAERLETSDEADVLKGRHADHFVALAERHEWAVLGGDPRESLDVFEREHDNLRAALDRLGSSEPERAMLLTGAMFEFWCLRGHSAEGWRRAEALLAISDRATPGRARALTASLHLAVPAGADPAIVRGRGEEAIRLNAELGRAWDVAHAMHQLGAHYVETGDPAKALALLEESVGRYRDAGHEHGELMATRALAWAHLELGDLNRYRSMIEELLRRARASGNRRMQAQVLGALGWVATEDGRYDDALALLREAYPIEREIGDPTAIGLLLTRLALLFARWGRHRAAAELLARAEAVREELGENDPGWVAEFKRTTGSLVRAALTQDEVASATARGRGMTNDEAATLALA